LRIEALAVVEVHIGLFKSNGWCAISDTQS